MVELGPGVLAGILVGVAVIVGIGVILVRRFLLILKLLFDLVGLRW